METTSSAEIDMAGKSCLAADCHDTLIAKKLMHPPAMQGDCDVCHTPAAGPTVHRFQPSSPTLQLCGECHKDLKKSFAFEHAPFHENCTTCHDPHAGDARYYIVAESADQLCLDCHEDVLEKMEFLHGPVAFKACLSCHTSHDSDHKGLLVRPPDRLCVYCHFNFKKAAERAASLHEPMRENCFECHNAHGGESRLFLPATEKELCKQCHDKLFEQMDNAKYPHRAMTDRKDCSDCHDAHWSDSTNLLKRPAMQLCLECHTDSIETEGGRNVAAVGQLFATNSHLHGPIEQDDCTPCHAAHGSDDPRLMKDNFPLGFYAPYTPDAYALCFGCHDPAIVEEKSFQSTRFRNGEQNLHFFHVREEEKGRSCRACHHEHASNAPFHIRDWVTYGKWKMDIDFRPTASGGTCVAGCHNARGYDRMRPVSNPLSGPAEQMARATRATSPEFGRAHLRPGTIAPDFTLGTADGQTTVTMGVTAGDRLLVLIRPGQRFTTETLAMCRRLSEPWDTFRGRPTPFLIWVGPALGDEAVELSRGLGRPWATLLDIQGEVGRAYRMVVSPTIYLVNAEGRVTHVFPGWQPRLQARLTAILRNGLDRKPPPEPAASTQQLSPEMRATLYLSLAREMELQGRHDEARLLYERARSVAKPVKEDDNER